METLLERFRDSDQSETLRSLPSDEDKQQGLSSESSGPTSVLSSGPTRTVCEDRPTLDGNVTIVSVQRLQSGRHCRLRWWWVSTDSLSVDGRKRNCTWRAFGSLSRVLDEEGNVEKYKKVERVRGTDSLNRVIGTKMF